MSKILQYDEIHDADDTDNNDNTQPGLWQQNGVFSESSRANGKNIGRNP